MGAGGARHGAGRKSKSLVLAEQKELIKELQQLTRTGLRVAAQKLPALIEAELEVAFYEAPELGQGQSKYSSTMRQKARHFLIDLVMDKVDMSGSDEENPLSKLLRGWDAKAKVTIEPANDVARDGQGHPIDAQYRPL
jgi:hypothetical protein